MDEITTFTEGNNVPFVEDALNKQKSYKPTSEEQKKLVRIRARYEEDMLPAQQPFHAEWDEANDAYENTLDGDILKEKFRISISHIVINAGMAEKIDAFADIAIGTQEPNDRNKIPYLEAAKLHALRQAKWDKTKMEALRISMIYGLCPVRIYYSRETRRIQQRVSSETDAGFEITMQEVTDFPFDDIRFEVIDNPRRFLIDDSAKNIDQAEDCALITEVNWNFFKQKVQNDNRYKNVEYVQPGTDFTIDIQGREVTPEQQAVGTKGTKVRIVEYWNKIRDEYVMIANGVMIRDTSLVDDHKQLPFAVLHQYRRPHSFYSKGVPKLLESLEELYTSIMRAEARATKLAFPILATAEGVSLDTRAVATYPGVVLEGAHDNASLMQLGTVPREAYALKDKIEELVIWLTGINFKQVIGQENERVGIAALKKESMMSRINMILRENEADFLLRLGDFLIQDIQQYYPVPRVRRLMKVDDADDVHEDELIRDKDGNPVGRLEIRKIPLSGMKLSEDRSPHGAFSLRRNVDGDSYIFARAEYIRTASKLDVRAVRPSAMGSSKEAKKLSLTELSAHAINVNASAMEEDENGRPIPNPIWNQQYIEEELAKSHDLDVEKAIFSATMDEPDAEESMIELTDQFTSMLNPPSAPPASQLPVPGTEQPIPQPVQ